MNRRAFLLAGSGALALAAAPYAPLPFGDNFEEFVAETLGLDEAIATALLERLRADLGTLEYDERAWTFSIAFRSPWSGLVPESLKRSALERLVEPLFAQPGARLAYVENRAPGEACAGLRRPA